MSYKIILDTKIPVYKSVFIGLTYIYGLGHTKSNYIINKLGFSKTYKISELTYKQTNQIQKLIKKYKNTLNSKLKY